jgi:acyl dehydratase
MVCARRGDQMRWLQPVHPDDTLRGRLTVIDTRISKSRPTMGILRSNCEMFNQHDELVMTLVGIHFVGSKPEGSAS